MAKQLQDYLSQASKLALSRLQAKLRRGTGVRAWALGARPGLLPRQKPPERNWVQHVRGEAGGGGRGGGTLGLWDYGGEQRRFQLQIAAHRASGNIFRKWHPSCPQKPSYVPQTWQSRVDFWGNLAALSSAHPFPKLDIQKDGPHVSFPAILYIFLFF